MNATLINTVGAIAAVLTTASWLPQLARTWKSRSARDISWLYLSMFSSGVALWMIYGLLRHDRVIVAANLVTLLLVASIMVVKFQDRTGGSSSSE